MHSFIVTLPGGEFAYEKADLWYVYADGSLIFTDISGMATAYAAGHWLKVKRVIE